MKRRSRKRRRSSISKLDFRRLEPRQMLAGDLIGPHQVTGMFPENANVVVNGDFESFTEGSDRFFDESEVPGWNAFDAATGQEINIMTWNVKGFDNVLDIDSTTGDFDRVYQNVATEAATEYLIAFDYRNHPTFDPDASEFTHDFEVWWNGSLVGRYTGGDAWNTSVIRVTSSNLDTTQLLFCEISEVGAVGGDGRGALLDNVRVFKFDDAPVVNGSFEKVTNESSVFVSPDEIEGWSAITDDSDQPLLQIVDSGASDGERLLNLDTTAINRDMVFTDLNTIAGASYYVTFDMRIDGEQTINPDELRVRWGDAWAATIFGTDQWTTYGIFVTADSVNTNLMFLEPGGQPGSGSGPLIDNVQLLMVNEVAPQLVVDANGDEAGVDGSAVFVPGAGAQAIGGDIVLTNDSSEDLTSVVVSLGGVVDGANELLSISESSIPDNGAGAPKITFEKYNAATNQLTLSGAATAEEYQAVLRTLTYFNAADDVSTSLRQVNIEATRGDGTEAAMASAMIELSIETDQQAIDSAIIQKYIADNNLNAQDLGGGLFAVIDEPGTGPNPTADSTVRVKYNGKFIELNDQNRLVEGDSFNFSSEEGFTTSLNSVIEGWTIGIQAFKTGGMGQLLIPSDMGYGPSGFGSIPGNTVLLFDVELLEIIS